MARSVYNARVGTWRSLVAYLNGVQVVASSNLAVPTITSNILPSLSSAAGSRDSEPLAHSGMPLPGIHPRRSAETGSSG